MTTVAEIRRLVPDASVVYYGDSENCPYGDRSKTELLRITSEIVQKLQKQGAEIIVIACNTATTQCIRELRKSFPSLTFVGTEPAIKVACDSGCHNILLMATSGTIKSTQVKRLITDNIDKQTINLLPCPGLADLIEITVSPGENSSFYVNKSIKAKLDDLLLDLHEREIIDGVVLGCTHYVYLKSVIQAYFPNAKIVDGNLGVAKRVQSLLD